MQLQLETTNTCNADCVFCSYSQMTRPKGTMAWDLFAKILDEAVRLPQIDRLSLTGLGEPLLDRDLVKRIIYARSQAPTLPIVIYTNGTYLRPTMTDALIAAGLSDLHVSLNATHAEGRQQSMRLDDWDTVIANLQYARAAVQGTQTQLFVKGLASKDLLEVGDHEVFRETWGGDVDQGGLAVLTLEGNWAGALGAPLRVQPKLPCHRALQTLMVLWDGRVSLCCFDGFGEVILGDLNRQTIREVYAGPIATGIRTAHLEGLRHTLPLCRTCTAI